VPLSEHEQRLLDQIERQLYAEDPKFASAVRSHDVKSHLGRRIKKFSALLALGLVALVAGAVLQNVFVGVAGFLVMLAAGLVIARSLQRLSRGETLPRIGKQGRGRKRGGGGGRAPKGPSGGAGGKGTLRDRAEERFRRRFDEPDR
jgi:uncharacterized membrane protein YgcG